MVRGKPESTEYASFFNGYLSLVPEEEILPALEGQEKEVRSLFSGMPAARETHRYEPGKWSIREVLGHMADAERVFGYRAFCISRGEKTSLPGFDEGFYVARSGYDARPASDLLEEFVLARRSNIPVLRSLGDDAWRNVGTANNNPVSVRALAYIMVGHARHHANILRSRYGVGGA